MANRGNDLTILLSPEALATVREIQRLKNSPSIENAIEGAIGTESFLQNAFRDGSKVVLHRPFKLFSPRTWMGPRWKRIVWPERHNG